MDLHEISLRARKAFYEISGASASLRNQVMHALARALESRKESIFEANKLDFSEAEASGLAMPLLQRLRFDEGKLSSVIAGLNDLAGLEDPIGKTTYANELTEGLKLYRVTCPIGVIGVIFESRPDALIQIASLAIKSGNAVLLKGGREALRTNQILCSCVRDALRNCGLNPDAAQLLETREDVAAMLKEDTLIDLIIPRGSNAFVRYIIDNSRIPVLGHADGICHVYIDSPCDPEIAIRVAVDSKTQNVSVCNAMETLLVNREVAESILPPLAIRLRSVNVRLLGDDRVQSLISCEAATNRDWATEYLDWTLSIKIVDSLDEAIDHINTFGSHHTDCIVSESDEHASRFMTLVDSAGVYRNVSTRFADGFVYGFGAEVGIATGKLHARGPMGLEGLTTYKYKLLGSGQTMAEVKSGIVPFVHRRLDESCPL